MPLWWWLGKFSTYLKIEKRTDSMKNVKIWHGREEHLSFEWFAFFASNPLILCNFFFIFLNFTKVVCNNPWVQHCTICEKGQEKRRHWFLLCKDLETFNVDLLNIETYYGSPSLTISRLIDPKKSRISLNQWITKSQQQRFCLVTSAMCFILTTERYSSYRSVLSENYFESTKMGWENCSSIENSMHKVTEDHSQGWVDLFL